MPELTQSTTNMDGQPCAPKKYQSTMPMTLLARDESSDIHTIHDYLNPNKEPFGWEK